MIGVKVLVVLSCLVSPLLARGAQIGKNGLERKIEKQKPSQRVDAALDPLVNIGVATNGMTTELFASCKADADRAYVRFRELYYPSGAEFTRYVPSDDQLSSYTPNWSQVTSVSINSFDDCGAYAEQDSDIMMFKYENSICSVSSLRLSTTTPKCGDTTAESVFVRTTCPEPVITSVTLTPYVNTAHVSWLLDDPCDLVANFEVIYTFRGDIDSEIMDGSSTRNYIITDIPGCSIVTATVVPLDSSGQIWGSGNGDSDTTTSEPPVISDVVVKATGIVTFEVTWTVDDPCELVAQQYVLYEYNATAKSDSSTVGPDARMDSKFLPGCDDLEVTVQAQMADGTELAEGKSDPSVALHDAVCDGNFQQTCSGCFVQKLANDNFITSQSYCTNTNADAKFLTVGSSEELDALREYLTFYHPTGYLAGTHRFWVDLSKIDGKYIWGTTNYEQPDDTDEDWVDGQPNSSNPSPCYYLREETAKGYVLGDYPCHYTSGVYPMCYYN